MSAATYNPAGQKPRGTTAEKLRAMRNGWYCSPRVSFGHGVFGTYGQGGYYFTKAGQPSRSASQYNAEAVIKEMRSS